MLKCIWNRQYCALWNAIHARDEIVWSIFDGLVIEHHAKHHSCWVNILLTLQSFCTNRLTGWLTVAIRIMINHTQYALFISSAHSSLGMSLCVCVCARTNCETFAYTMSIWRIGIADRYHHLYYLLSDYSISNVANVMII